MSAVVPRHSYSQHRSQRRCRRCRCTRTRAAWRAWRRPPRRALGRGARRRVVRGVAEHAQRLGGAAGARAGAAGPGARSQRQSGPHERGATKEEAPASVAAPLTMPIRAAAIAKLVEPPTSQYSRVPLAPPMAPSISAMYFARPAASARGGGSVATGGRHTSTHRLHRCTQSCARLARAPPSFAAARRCRGGRAPPAPAGRRRARRRRARRPPATRAPPSLRAPGAGASGAWRAGPRGGEQRSGPRGPRPSPLRPLRGV